MMDIEMLFIFYFKQYYLMVMQFFVNTTVHVRQYIPKNYANRGLALVLPPPIDPMPPLCHTKNDLLDLPLCLP